MGSAVLYLAWLATGRLDGRVTNLTGGALDLDAPGLVASNGKIHDAMTRRPRGDPRLTASGKP